MSARPARDPRLDFFRGSAMFIIFIAHCRGNFLWDWIPARFGMSDAADMFVFLSGYAASIAFGGTFVRSGFLLGTARIALRCWQLYLGHLGLFLAVATLCVVGTALSGDADYVALLGLQRFFTDTPAALVGLLGLFYVPHYFDILPLYIVVLAMVPAAMLLARLHPLLVPAASLVLYAAAVAFRLDFIADAADGREWYFNPLAWQLIFFTGFALGRGWLRAPAASRPLVTAASLYLLLGLAISLPNVFEALPPIDAARIWVMAHSDKTYLDLLQYLHFLAEAYLAVLLLRGREQVLLRPALRPIVKCGQQALSVFLTGMVLSHAGGMVFDHLGTGLLPQLAVNGASFAILVGVAYTVAWFKAAPWKKAVPAPAHPSAAPVAAEPPSPSHGIPNVVPVAWPLPSAGLSRVAAGDLG
jgi:hypothetical protein